MIKETERISTEKPSYLPLSSINEKQTEIILPKQLYQNKEETKSYPKEEIDYLEIKIEMPFWDPLQEKHLIEKIISEADAVEKKPEIYQFSTTKDKPPNLEKELLGKEEEEGDERD
ncbi:hypothetical protein [Methanonatronarchaeum sp. AMET-Sl]|uniref:hypothetical protein n=1 Tax=Methanonatronarchaeum sp. AMET-Sl TaxID=3037654 RepID=UPI00244E358F|nr:hypothetical protein [Methanonatronarchaeum sp. AMET-Sl]WGI17761.1 hypothetical protein QEN48_01780 [Methanonatronarchaeum sp. AMET-Sl]